MTSAWVEIEHLRYRDELAALARKHRAAAGDPDDTQLDQDGSGSLNPPPEPGRGSSSPPPSAAGEHNP